MKYFPAASARAFSALALSLAMAMPVSAATVRVEDVRTIPFSSNYSYYPVVPIQLDFDGDGVLDVRLSGSAHSSSRSSSSRLYVAGLNGTMVDSGPKLISGSSVDSSLSFVEPVVLASYSRSRRRFGGSRTSYGGAWSGNGETRYIGFLGIKLTGDRFGWLELDISNRGSGRLLAWGYEREANTAIAAGAAQTYVAPPETLSTVPLPASALTLLAGLGGLVVMRRRQNKG